MKLKKLMKVAPTEHSNPYTQDDLDQINILLEHLTTDTEESFDKEVMVSTIEKVKTHIEEELAYGI